MELSREHRRVTGSVRGYAVRSGSPSRKAQGVGSGRAAVEDALYGLRRVVEPKLPRRKTAASKDGCRQRELCDPSAESARVR
jgi:hypothetical protein